MIKYIFILYFLFILSGCSTENNESFLLKDKKEIKNNLEKNLYFEFLYIDLYNYVIEHHNDKSLIVLSKEILNERNKRSLKILDILNNSNIKKPTLRLDGGINYNHNDVNNMFIHLKKISNRNKKTILSFMCIFENSSYYTYNEIAKYKKENGELYASFLINKYSNDSYKNLNKIDNYIRFKSNNKKNCCDYVNVLCSK